jgi:hypothetical protein
MKKLMHLLIAAGALAGLGYILWTGVRKQQEKPAGKEEAAAAEEEKPEEFVVMLEKKRATALAIEKEQPQKMELTARRRAFGTVLDPSPLVVLDGELAAAEAALTASKAESDRTQALMATNDTSKKIAEGSRPNFSRTRSRSKDWSGERRCNGDHSSKARRQNAAHWLAIW